VLSDVRPVIAAIDRTISAMGYDLVDVEFAGAGLLRVYIDLPASAFEQLSVPANSPEAPMIKVEDCERVSHQLTHFLTVENIDYSRLEVSSPGLDRPLKREADFARFEGAEVSLRLREPLSGRRNFVGVLVRDESAPDRWALDLIESPKLSAKSAGKASANGRGSSNSKSNAKSSASKPGTGSAESDAEVPADASEGEVVRRLSFVLSEVERARLVPKVKF
jgi:ribosome maturation factor RimP